MKQCAEIPACQGGPDALSTHSALRGKSPASLTPDHTIAGCAPQAGYAALVQVASLRKPATSPQLDTDGSAHAAVPSSCRAMPAVAVVGITIRVAPTLPYRKATDRSISVVGSRTVQFGCRSSGHQAMTD
jgi:hypothetical protein